MDVHNREQRSRNMRAIRSAETKMERALFSALWAKGLRFRKNVKTVFGKPDLAIKKYKVAVFVDSEFFHGKDWEKNKYRIGTNREFWWKKIEGNMRRDVLVNRTLRKEGWSVVRFWSGDVKKSPDKCCNKIFIIIEKIKAVSYK